MFGYVAAASDMLTEEQRKRYKAFYCGLCRSLGERFGSFARMTLTYDMTFLVILLGSLYEPPETAGTEKCPAHPAKAQKYVKTDITDYAADMTMVLGYFNRVDDWNDDGSIISLAESAAMKSAYLNVREKYPEKCERIERSLSELSGIEQSRELVPDAAASCFGSLMAELFDYRNDFWSRYLRDMGMALGRFIYIMDACIDLKGDKRYYRYNPMLPLYGAPDEEKRFKNILEMLMAQCVGAFEAMPMLQDADIIRNILCLGVWTGFNKHYNIKAEKGAVPDGTGSV